MKQILQVLVVAFVCLSGQAQVNSGSNGSDGALNPTTNIVINMADHPDGIYHYTSVNIPSSVQVTFIPNVNNTPVVWLVQSNCVISGNVSLAGGSYGGSVGGVGGPGGWAGGSGGNYPSAGLGPGGGGSTTTNHASGGSFGSRASFGGGSVSGPVYGNGFLLPLLGGSGGGGANNNGGGGGGGAILIAASGYIQLNGSVDANGGTGGWSGTFASGMGSGGAVRLVTLSLTGAGSISASGGRNYGGYGGDGRIRIDAYQSTFGGYLSGVISQGFQPIIIPTAGQGAQLTVTSVGGVFVSASPTGQLVTPDAVLSAQQNNPIPIVVHCSNIPLNTQITVSVKPANGPTVSATGYNSTGTLSSSTATISINMPRGGGLIYATAATGN